MSTLLPNISTLSQAAQAPITAGFSWDPQQLGKRLMDFSIALTGVILISPLLLAMAIAIKVSSEGPVLYPSKRIGKGYKPFFMYKFRTMQPNADSLREQLRQQANLQGELFKIENDPRITPIGQFLRKYSLDELPQLLNVIKGEMSLVGPRPLPEDESLLFEEPYTRRFSVKPGITGLWQVSGRSGLNFKKLCELEFTYISKWTLLKDIQILFQTIPAVLFSKGAC